MSQNPRVLVVGIGSPHGDDQAGWLVAENLASHYRADPDIVVRRASIPLDMLDWLDGIDVLHICDACESPSGQRMLHRLRWNTAAFTDGWQASPQIETNTTDMRAIGPLRSQRGRGSHDFGVFDVLRLAEATQLLPGKVIVWAIQGNSFGPAEAVGDECRVAVLEAVSRIRSDLEIDCYTDPARNAAPSF